MGTDGRLGGLTPAMRRRAAAILALVATCTLGGCAGGSGEAVIESDPQPAPAPAEFAPLGRSGYGPTASDDADLTIVGRDVEASDARAGDDIKRPDGRPWWWIERPEYERGYVRVCAEALGPTLGAARDAALANGRLELRRLLLLAPEAGPVSGERVERTWVTPLPAKGGPNAFAGYVMISGPVP